MIAHRARENRRLKSLKLTKNLERLYKEGKCRECAVVVTRMDFAKILGKFTKVKIQYESSSTPKTKKNSNASSPNANTRLKSNENGMVLIRRNAYNQHPVKEPASPAKAKTYPKQGNNVLKENNRLKKTQIMKDKNSNINITSSNQNKKQTNLKRYGIVFMDPTSKNHNNNKSKTSLEDLLPLVNKSILPSEEWCIDYLPRSVEPMDDKVYDRIAAELEDLMYNEKVPAKQETKTESDSKVEEFPSIMDILNDNTNDSSKTSDQSSSIEYKGNLESSDVEAILLGKATTPKKDAMEVDSAVMNNLIEDVAQLNAIQEAVSSESDSKISGSLAEMDNPHSPSILDEALQKGIEEHLPCGQDPAQNSDNNESSMDSGKDKDISEESKSINSDTSRKMNFPSNITHLIFKKTSLEKCVKTVTCPKNLKYSIDLEGKSVEFLGAPKFISSIEDLQVLLQIVNETELKNLYVYH
ncbi:uncharacterized protein LOC135078208 [Ostrinia nubilalis]|uniref:uncharacterized protein LOC135078208 n=1 Tax=Ostrinia nubilalis TaxID=29057 RepID=UPI0030826506